MLHLYLLFLAGGRFPVRPFGGPPPRRPGTSFDLKYVDAVDIDLYISMISKVDDKTRDFEISKILLKVTLNYLKIANITTLYVHVHFFEPMIYMYVLVFTFLMQGRNESIELKRDS